MFHEREWIREAYEMTHADPWWAPLAAGISLVLFGLLVLLVPRLLEVLVALALIGLGAWIAYRAWQRRPKRWRRPWGEIF